MEEIPGARYIYKRGEAAQLTRPFQGDASTLNGWLFTQQLGVTRDTVTPDFVLDSLEAVENGAVADAKQIFYADPLGVVFTPTSPSDPNVVSKVSWEPRSVIIGTTQTADGLFIVNYLSPIISYRYCTSTAYNTPNFYSADNVSTPGLITIFDFAFAPNNPNAGTVNFAPSGTWNYKTYPICTGFNRDQKASVYNYIETYSVIIQNPTGNPPVQLPAGTPALPDTQ